MILLTKHQLQLIRNQAITLATKQHHIFYQIPTKQHISISYLRLMSFRRVPQSHSPWVAPGGRGVRVRGQC
jgi:hypothetical protein